MVKNIIFDDEKKHVNFNLSTQTFISFHLKYRGTYTHTHTSNVYFKKCNKIVTRNAQMHKCTMYLSNFVVVDFASLGWYSA